MLYKLVVTESLILSVTIQMKATEQYFPVVLFIILYKVFQTFVFMGEIIMFDNSNGSSLPSFSFTVIFRTVELLENIHTSSHLELFVNDCQIPNISSNHNLE